MIKHIATIVFIISALTTARGQHFQNVNFTQKCDSSKTGLCFWDLSWGKEKSVRPEIIEGKNTIAISGEKETSVGFTEQEINTTVNEIQIISIAALVKSDGIIGKGAGLNIGLYDKDNVLIGTKDMGGFYSVDWITGTQTWKKHSISIVCPKETQKIKIGMILFGKGTVWFSDFAVNTTRIGNREPSKLAIKYINSACEIIAKNSLVRDSVNIAELKQTALKIAGPAKKYSDCFLAVQYLLASLRPFGDHHSFFMSANEKKNWEKNGSQVSKIAYPTHKIIDGCGYILVPPFHGGNTKHMSAYADSLQNGIRNLSNSKIKGWIVDLRQNTGGNMEPMLAGLGPLFSAEKLGSLIDVNQKSNAWYYKQGKYYSDEYKGWKVSKPFHLTSSLPIAVLTSNQTGSSGEIVAISFRGNANTQSFGKPTWGLTTGNSSFDLPDGSQLFLAATIMADRNGQKYTSSVQPDFDVENLTTTSQDETIDTAIQWIFSK